MMTAQLFATSKSLMNLKTQNSPYKFCPKNAVPKFGGSKNPFASSGSLASQDASVPALKVQPQVALPEDLPLFEPRSKPCITPAQESIGTLELAASAKASAPAVCENRAILTRGPVEVVLARPANKATRERSMGGGLISALFALGGVGRAAAPVAEKPVQTEFQLSRVPVKRNSLHNVDLQVVCKSADGASGVRSVEKSGGISQRGAVGGMGAAILRVLAFGQLNPR